MKAVIYILLFLLNVVPVFADASIALTNVPRDDDGKIQMMSWFEADTYCKDLGLRLPTASEVARYFNKFGTVVARETAYPGVSKDDPRVVAEMNQMRKTFTTSVNSGAILSWNNGVRSAEVYIKFDEDYPSEIEGNQIWTTSKYLDLANPIYYWFSTSPQPSFGGNSPDYPSGGVARCLMP